MCEKKYGKEGARERIVATTDREKGALKKLATDKASVDKQYRWTLFSINCCRFIPYRYGWYRH